MLDKYKPAELKLNLLHLKFDLVPHPAFDEGFG